MAFAAAPVAVKPVLALARGSLVRLCSFMGACSTTNCFWPCEIGCIDWNSDKDLWFIIIRFLVTYNLI